MKAVVELSDPRSTRGMKPASHQVVMDLLRQPWELHMIEVEHLEAVLAREEGLNEKLVEAGLEREAFVGEIAAMTFAEKLALVDQALVRWAKEEGGRGSSEQE